MTAATSARDRSVVYGPACDPFDLLPLSDPWELERLALFGLFVVGKSARVAWPKTRAFLDVAAWRRWCGQDGPAPAFGPFEFVEWLQRGGETERWLRHCRVGQYARLLPALRAVAAAHRVDAPTHARLAGVPGLALKTRKLVELYTHPGGRCACLDRHVLRPMAAWPSVRKLGLRVPDAAPSDPDVYAVLEALFLRRADEAGVEPWRLDKSLWQAGALKPAQGA